MRLKFIQILLIWIFITAFNITFAQESIPEINEQIINFVETVIGSTVGRGECWDLADWALTTAGARFDKTSQKTIYIYGESYKPQKEEILPGDLIQFENVMVSYRDGNLIYTENLRHHTAIVYQINTDSSLKLAHQNTGFAGKKVALSNLDLANVKKGNLYFYHPVPD